MDKIQIEPSAGMFPCFEYGAKKASDRARVLYCTELEYFVLNVQEGADARARLNAQYAYCHSGKFPTEQEMQILNDAFDQAQVR